jgi:hypothetical protein
MSTQATPVMSAHASPHLPRCFFFCRICCPCCVPERSEALIYSGGGMPRSDEIQPAAEPQSAASATREGAGHAV